MADWPYEHIEDHEERALSRFTYQYSEADVMKGLAQIWAERTQVLEDAAWTLLTDRWADSAEGQQLNRLGAIVGEPRSGRDEEEYRQAIQTRISVNRSGGEPERIIEFLRRIAGADQVLYKEEYPAKIEIFVGGDVSFEQARRVRDLVPAGVGTIYIGEAGGLLPFGTKDGEDDEPVDVDGFGELGFHIFVDENGDVLEASDGAILGGNDRDEPLLPTEGGYLAELYEV